MADGIKVLVSVPTMLGERWIKEMFLIDENGAHHIPEGVYTVPIPVWEKMTVDYQPNKLGESSDQNS